MTTQEKYADRIAKLLRKAESTTPEEAEALFAKAQELMAKYAIDAAMLRAAGNLSQKDDPLTEEEFVTVGIYRHALYMIDFYVLSVNGCEVVEFTGSPWRTIDGRTFKQTRVLKAVGYKSDLDRARVLLTSLKLQCMRAETSWWKENEYLYKSMSNGDQHKARRGFMFSFGKGANKKMQDAVAAARKTAETENTSGTSVALVLRDKGQMVRDEFEKRHPNLRSSRSRISQGDAYAREHGYAAGQRADTSTGGSAMGGKRKEINR